MSPTLSSLQYRYRHWRHDPPVKTSATVLTLIVAGVVALVLGQFRGVFDDKVDLTLLAARSGLAMDTGSKVTYNGVEIGRVAQVSAVEDNGQPGAQMTLKVDPKFISAIPANVMASVKASTVFGNKYVAFTSPPQPDATRVSPGQKIRVSAVTTEFNSLFETVVDITKQIDPIKLNQTLTAVAQALDGLGQRLGQSLDDGNTILADLNPRMPRIREDVQKLADLADIYTQAGPDFWDGLGNGATTAKALNDEQSNIDQALMSAVGFGNTGGEVFEKSSPYLVRSSADLVPTLALFDEYSPMIFCTIRNYHDVAPKFSAYSSGNGYSLNLHNELVGAGNPWVYPDNLPRVNASGGPEGRPGCWQPVTRDLWPMPYLVMDTGASIAPYNHLGLGQPIAREYVWGRQVGENTINP